MPLLELLVVVFALLAIATPFITLVLLGKYNKLRENLDQLAEENSRQHTSFQRDNSLPPSTRLRQSQVNLHSGLPFPRLLQ